MVVKWEGGINPIIIFIEEGFGVDLKNDLITLILSGGWSNITGRTPVVMPEMSRRVWASTLRFAEGEGRRDSSYLYAREEATVL